ncbi:transaldolase [Cordyceps fumosorosea ARSEF 2679]|uniref:Transaldolase n=1 Tax=Cordyceps fumosorosea (strain ARSEF 2679) TaxID=1081104 RepID=A0A168CD20_CORFA|nr:transaldolase [Cordyceps fumosorosea ARSEF 2679]OAA71238.1 transaldolase [Cordyceps fumosorosea ARSEF 2679]
MAKTTWFDVLQHHIKIDIDGLDPADTAALLPFVPFDQTSNQNLVLLRMVAPENRELFLKTVRERKDDGWRAILDCMSVRLCALNKDKIRGRFLLQTSPADAYDEAKTLAHARAYAREFEKEGIAKDQFCIKIPATGPALNAGRELLKEGIRTLGTSLFSVPQAVAASQAGCLSISPYYNFSWYHTDRAQWPDLPDPALQHPMSPRIVQILNAYRTLSARSGPGAPPQPLVKMASFLSAREAMAMAELGCAHATIPANVLAELAALDVETNQPPPSQSAAEGVPAERLMHLAATDPLVADKVPVSAEEVVEVDYLADGGAALQVAIEADPMTTRGLEEALAMFGACERQSRAAIEEALKRI